MATTSLKQRLLLSRLKKLAALHSLEVREKVEAVSALCHLAGIKVWERRWTPEPEALPKFRLYHPVQYPGLNTFVDVEGLEIEDWQAAIHRLLYAGGAVLERDL